MWEMGEGVLGVGGKPKVGKTICWHRERAAVCSIKHKNSHSVYMSGQDGRWEQLDTTCSLIVVCPSGTIATCIHPV